MRVLMIAPTSFFSDYGGHIRIFEEIRILQKLGHQICVVTYPLGGNPEGIDVRRAGKAFVGINCAAIPETLLESELFGYEEGAFTGSRRGGRAGLFEAAHTGTIFLDEVGDVPVTLQTRLLRVLQERQVLRLGSNDPTPVDVRVVAATNRDLKREIARGAFREDLYYRLNILPVAVPPLRARAEDVAPIAEALLGDALARHEVPGALPRALALVLPWLRRYDWPGNVRELSNFARELVLASLGRPVARVGATFDAVLPPAREAGSDDEPERPAPAVSHACGSPAGPARPEDSPAEDRGRVTAAVEQDEDLLVPGESRLHRLGQWLAQDQVGA